MYLDNLFEWYFTIVNHECVGDYYLTPNENFFNYIMAKTRYISMFMKMISALYLGQQAKLEFHGAVSLKQLSMHTFLFTRRHYPVSLTSTFYLTAYLTGKAANISLIVFGLGPTGPRTHDLPDSSRSC